MKQVMIVRADLKMGKGKIAAQCCHASIGAYKNSDPKKIEKWENEAYAKVILKVHSLEDLMNQIDESDCVLIGIGEEYRVQERSKQEVLSALDGLFEIVKNKNYYVLDICDDRTIFESI